jgi:hypothetical protein
MVWRHSALEEPGDHWGLLTACRGRPALFDELVRLASSEHTINASPAPAPMDGQRAGLGGAEPVPGRFAELRDVYAHLIAQGMDAESAQHMVADYDERLQSEAFAAFIDAQPEPLLVAGVGATPEIRSARDVMEGIERRMADGSLRGGDIGAAIDEAHDAILRLGQAAEQAQGEPTRDQERVASRLLSMIGDLGRLAEQTGATLSPQQTALVRQA